MLQNQRKKRSLIAPNMRVIPAKKTARLNSVIFSKPNELNRYKTLKIKGNLRIFCLPLKNFPPLLDGGGKFQNYYP